jgi:hypothetical protein
MEETTISLAGAIANAQAMQDLVEALENEGFEPAQFALLASQDRSEGSLELAGAMPENEACVGMKSITNRHWSRSGDGGTMPLQEERSPCRRTLLTAVGF